MLPLFPSPVPFACAPPVLPLSLPLLIPLVPSPAPFEFARLLPFVSAPLFPSASFAPPCPSASFALLLPSASAFECNPHALLPQLFWPRLQLLCLLSPLARLLPLLFATVLAQQCDQQLRAPAPQSHTKDVAPAPALLHWFHAQHR